MHERCRVEACEPQPWPQVGLGVGQQVLATVWQWLAMADGRDQVGQGLVSATGHSHIAHGHQAHAQEAAQGLQLLQPGAVVCSKLQAHAHPEAIAQAGLEPLPGGMQAGLGAGGAGQPNGPAVLKRLVGEVVLADLVVALAHPASAQCDEPTQLLPALFVLGQEGQARALFEHELRAMNDGQAGGLASQVGPNAARDTGFIGEGQCGIAQGLGTRHQVFGVGGSRLKGKITRADELGVVHGGGCAQPKRPCRNHSWAGVRKTQTSRWSWVSATK